MKKKIIVLGSAGMAGHVLTKMLKDNFDELEVIDVSRGNKQTRPTVNLDVTDFSSLRELISKEAPDFVVNCTGILNKSAEDNPDIAILLNSYLPHFLEAITRHSETRIIHISTDCVFSGKRGGYNESDSRDGEGYYAQSKALGELINGKDLTIRTSIIGPEISDNPIGLFDWVMRQKGEINGYVNAIWSGVTTIELAKVIIEIINRPSIPTGIIHLTNNIKVSKFDLLTLIKNVFELKDIQIIEHHNYEVDKSFLNTRIDINFKVPSYLDMILEMKEWIVKTKNDKPI
jgi:dTDP-4-dehydrorhamnose reductase